MLKRVDVMDAGELGGYSAKHLTVFYTGLYRALTFPRRIDVGSERTHDA
jgi:putative alpha-1,2-mannosidase